VFLQIDRVPEQDRGHHQVKATGAVALVLETAVPDLAQTVEEDGAGQCVLGFSFVQADLDAAAQLDVLHPVEREQRPLDPAQLPQRDRQAVLPGIAAEFAQHQRGGDGPLLD